MVGEKNFKAQDAPVILEVLAMLPQLRAELKTKAAAAKTQDGLFK
jgi:hypothetical protein